MNKILQVGLYINSKPLAQFEIKRKSLSIGVLYDKFESYAGLKRKTYVLLREGFPFDEFQLKKIITEVQEYFEVNCIPEKKFIKNTKLGKRKLDLIKDDYTPYGEKKKVKR